MHTHSRNSGAKLPSRPATSSAVAPTHVNASIIHGPISPKEAVKKYSQLLSPYEKAEILKYDEIYYVGKAGKKETRVGSEYHFDLPTHHYKVTIGDHIVYRYEIRSLLGQGTFGQVLQCFDHKEKKLVAVKIMINTPDVTEAGTIEIDHLKRIIGQNNYCLQLLDSFTFRNHLCAVFDVLGQNLYDYTQAMKTRKIPEDMIKQIAKQVLIALDYSHSHGVVHCDLKPENITFVSGVDHNVRLIDFGSSCLIGEPMIYDYIQSRYYRAPEVILAYSYGPAMDIWSYGLVVAELYTGKTIFTGADNRGQMAKYIESFGLPPIEMRTKGKCSNEFFTLTGYYKQEFGKEPIKPGSVPISQLTKIKDPNLIDFLNKCFEWDPKKRISAREALKHPWIK
ncbi:hypothetical protein M9Y10_013071 [Tritrichomonas musculus]|uniref:dual-specificity kinase n=1 Tax=Tritrichomonas musculus TaxID=1915356 RepID=A0ABR2I7U3_9EUKA